MPFCGLVGLVVLLSRSRATAVESLVAPLPMLTMPFVVLMLKMGLLAVLVTLKAWVVLPCWLCWLL